MLTSLVFISNLIRAYFSQTYTSNFYQGDLIAVLDDHYRVTTLAMDTCTLPSMVLK